jgi:hypothetical protein
VVDLAVAALKAHMRDAHLSASSLILLKQLTQASAASAAKVLAAGTLEAALVAAKEHSEVPEMQLGVWLLVLAALQEGGAAAQTTALAAGAVAALQGAGVAPQDVMSSLTGYTGS